MKRLLGLLVQSIIIIFLFCAANAGNESTFKEKGYGAFSIKGPEQTGCFTVEFLRKEFPLLNEEGSHFIVSINATFKPEMHGTASIDFFINNEFIEGNAGLEWKFQRNYLKRTIGLKSVERLAKALQALK